ncbi:MAG: type restriction enzyme res subunit [Phycisphaerales bacterium]|nr:type restriction enzyme res subunit [Phycisphaerales bacterium]
MSNPDVRPRLIGLIDNAGPNNLLAFLADALDGACAADLAAAFVTRRGLDALLQRLLAVDGRVRVLTGFYGWVTEPAALRALLDGERRHPKHFRSRIAIDPRFHCKAYLITRGTTLTAVVGSSNLTGDGLTETGELNAAFAVPARSSKALMFRQFFEAAWASAVPLSATLIDAYAEARPAGSGEPGVVPITLDAALTSAKAPATHASRGRRPRYFRMTVHGFMSARTERALREETSWSRRKWGMVTARLPSLSIGDRIILFDKTCGWSQLVEVRDWTRTPMRTPDGRNFAAHTPVAGSHRRKLTATAWAAIRQKGLLTKWDAERDCRMSVVNAERLIKALRFLKA